MEEQREEHAVDSSLGSNFPVEEAKAVFHIAEQCLEADPSKRPAMIQVLKMLEKSRSKSLNN